jgi:hypothetical protein
LNPRIINTVVTLALAAACLATIASIAAAATAAAQRTVVVKRPPMVSPGDVSESWNARKNALDSERYD